MADDIFNFFASRLGSGDIWVVIEFPEGFSKQHPKCVNHVGELWHQEDSEDQDDSEQVAADEVAAAECLCLSRYTD